MLVSSNKSEDDKTKLQVLIAGEVVVLSGEESPEYIQRLARYIDKKMFELGREKKVVSFNSFTKTLLIALNIADDLFKEIDTNEDMRLKHAELLMEHKALESEFELLKSAARVANQKLEEQLAANEKLYKEMGTLKGRISELEAQKSVNIAERNMQNTQIESLKDELSRSNAEVELARSELSDYIDSFSTGQTTTSKALKFGKKQ